MGSIHIDNTLCVFAISMRSGELDMETAFEVSMALSEMAVVGFLRILEKYDESRKRTIMRYT